MLFLQIMQTIFVTVLCIFTNIISNYILYFSKELTF